MFRRLTKTPAELGYTFPAEWEPHAATWFSWPRPEGISFPGKYHTIPENLARIMAEISARERVEINVPNENWETIVRQQLKEHGGPTRNIFFHHIKTNEPWCRDHGPAFVVRKAPVKTQHPALSTQHSPLAIVDWRFNAWGGKYPPYDDDDQVPTRIAEKLKIPVFAPNIIMEGGAVDFSGRGTVMTTESCLLNKNRNPRLSKKRIEKYLKDFYGQRQVIWLGEGIAGDDTDGHIDDLARFISPTQIVTVVEPDPRDENHKPLQDNLRRLARLRDAENRRFEIIHLPMPAPIVRQNQRLPASYANFYFVNGACLVPTYRDRKNDRRALRILQDHLPNREVIGIDCTELIWGLGAIHCLTQQQPKI